MSASAQSNPVLLVKLKSHEIVAERTMAFHFEKPDGFTFTPGQFVEIGLLNPAETDEEGNIRAFSIASAPQETTLMVTTRLRDTAFKRVLKDLPPGTQVKLDGPFGDLRLHNNVKRTAVFLAGGIGITPFRSILLDAAYRKLPHRIFMFYCNHRPEDAAFLQELQSLEGQNPNYRFIGTMTDMEKSRTPWHGETGFITMEMIKRHIKDAESPLFYLVGPPGMVSGLHDTLQKAGVDDDDIRIEEFSGY